MESVVGVVDITTVGSATFQRHLAKEEGQPEFCVHSFPFVQYGQLVAESNWDGMADLILKSINKLQKSGATMIVIPSNTPHYAYQQIAESSSIPVLNLIEITVTACQQKQFNRVAVLGTQQTMTGTLYSKPLKKAGITPIIPDINLRAKINNLIYKIIAFQAPKGEINSVAKEIQEMDCDAFILGCTELPEVFNQGLLGKPCLDTTLLLAQAALKTSKEQQQETESISELGRSIFIRGMGAS